MSDTRRRPIDPLGKRTPAGLPDHYGTLGVDPAASHEAIKVAYRRLSVQLLGQRPATPTVARRLEQVRTAYAVLSDPVSRAEYDQSYRLAADRREPAVASADGGLAPVFSIAPSVVPSVVTNQNGNSHHQAPADAQVVLDSTRAEHWPNGSIGGGAIDGSGLGGALAVVAEPGRVLPLYPFPPLAVGETLASLLARLRALGLVTENSLVFVLMLVSMVFHGLNMFEYPSFIALDDEGTYIAQAWAVAVRGQLDHYTYNYGHVPGGWILLAAFMVMTGGPRALVMPVNSGRVLMLLLQVAMVPLLYRLARKLGCGIPAAALACFLCSVSPLAIFYQRVFLLDSVMMFWTLLSLFFLLDDKGRLSRVVLSGFFFGLALMSKETDVFLLPAVLYIAWRWRRRHHGHFAMVGWLLPMAVVTSWYVLFATLKGELLPAGFSVTVLGMTLSFGTGPHVSLIESLLWQLSRNGGSAFDLQNQFWWNIRNVWMPKDDVLIAGGMAAVVLNLLRGVRSHRVFAVGLLGLFPLLYFAHGGIVFGFYILFAIPFLCLNLGALVGPLFTHLPTRYASILAISMAGYLLAHYWQAGTLQPLFTEQASDSAREAVVWVKQHLPPQSKIVGRDSFWTDMHERELGGPAFPHFDDYWQVGTNPAIKYGVFHNDWRRVDYLLMLPDMLPSFRSTNNTIALDAYNNSCLLKTWRDPDGTRIELWKVDKTGASKGKPYSGDPECATATPTKRLVPAEAGPGAGVTGSANVTPSPVAMPTARSQEPPRSAGPTTRGLPPAAGRDGVPLPRTYVVRPGDTLSSIAARVYGNVAAWPDIVAANPGELSDPDRIYPGEKLKLPPRQR